MPSWLFQARHRAVSWGQCRDSVQLRPGSGLDIHSTQ